jgi:hypothetical protein
MFALLSPLDMPDQSTAAVDTGQHLLLTIVLFYKYNDNSGLLFVRFVVVKGNSPTI